MNRRRPEPRVQRPIPYFMAWPPLDRRQQRPDSAWRDALVVGLAIAFLLLIYLLAPLAEHVR